MAHRSLRIDWDRNSGYDYAIVEPRLGMIRDIKKLMCPLWCADITGRVYSGDGCGFKGFRVTSAGFEGCQADEEDALHVARTCILAFLRPRISDVKVSADPEVVFRVKCAVLGLENLWLELVPFLFQRWHRSDAKRAERTERAALGPEAAAAAAEEDRLEAEEAIRESRREMPRQRHAAAAAAATT